MILFWSAEQMSFSSREILSAGDTCGLKGLSLRPVNQPTRAYPTSLIKQAHAEVGS